MHSRGQRNEAVANPDAPYSLVLSLDSRYHVFNWLPLSLWMVHRAIDILEEEELQQRIRSVRRFVESRPAHETSTQLHDAITAAYSVTHGTKWLQVVDEHGNWLYRSPHVAAVYPTLVLPQQAPTTNTISLILRIRSPCALLSSQSRFEAFATPFKPA
jgi:hypothetical protein